ncbi:MAG: cyclic nucleotide-binding domain-containing protein [Candidatus Pacebacteria bacterium]|nr:cyclic nucleotide-binding domain-containing protein [Candidatus Paceibacterota bacterium]
MSIEENCELLAQLPKSIRTELIFRQNVGFIQKVKLFQLSDVSFIIAILRHTQPMICMAGDHIVRKGELAESMYFIKRGLAKVVCADDENVVISYLGEGAYFGEIGVLTTGKRSTSVIAHTDCVLLSIDKPTLLEILDEFGHHKKFLEMVAKQRLETTYTTDIQIAEGSGAEAERERERENTNLPNSETTLPRQLFASRVLVPQQQRTKAFRRAELCELCAVLFAVLWNVCYTIFALCFEVIITEHHYTVIAIDIVALTVYAGDLVFQYYAGQMRYFPSVIKM